MSLSLQIGSTQTLTVPVPRPNFYSVNTAKLFIKQGSRPSRTVSVSSATPDAVVFNVSFSRDDARMFADCGDCAWKPGTYQVILYEGAASLDPPFKVIGSGSVSFSGALPCSSCGGEDPPPGPAPPGSPADNPYGPVDPGDRQVPEPGAPPAGCLPPSFGMPSPTVPTPCGGSGGTGKVGFSNV